MAVNCGALPEALIESELFGHARAPSPGRDRGGPGKFELADGGTLFLDEIGELPPTMQAKLLRVLEEREVARRRRAHAREVDVRVVAATNRDLRRDREHGAFREDLYFRLACSPHDAAAARAPRGHPALAEHLPRAPFPGGRAEGRGPVPREAAALRWRTTGRATCAS